ncbi:hypothetical protein [Aurantiacibacter sp. MUD61]|uniref:hypothetical protein n=1 Tax=Aurantiacibacter sp. MUD61 TaxID=3009083 RepID=UPI0022F07906|nr:hypothetical protein [Aurantiacibacter sp. MUD61]
MKNMMTAFAAISLALGVTACGDNGDADTDVAASDGTITGTWLIDADTAEFEGATTEILLADGTYECMSCNPPYSVTANGEWQDVDLPGADALMVEVVDDNSVRTAGSFGGEEQGSSVWTVSEDGQTVTIEFTDTSGDEVVTGSQMMTRAGDGPEGSHVLSGQWETQGVSGISDAGLTVSYAVEGDQFTTSGNGFSYTATIGGEPVPVEGSNAGNMAAVESTGENSYLITNSRDGETLSTTELTVDGDSLSGVNTNMSNGGVVRWTAARE